MLTGADPPRLAILDWLMPGLDGVEVCRRVRAAGLRPMYLILLTGRGSKQHVVEGLQAGANDYITKPFDPDELHARVSVGARMVSLEQELAQRVRELEEALAQVQTLQGLLPICAYCKKIRDDGNYWHQLESYIQKHSAARFSHGICPTCFAKVMQELKDQGLVADSPNQEL
jgi:CheY-like chemotaxis protein